jgi:hypothetical protein
LKVTIARAPRRDEMRVTHVNQKILRYTTTLDAVAQSGKRLVRQFRAECQPIRRDIALNEKPDFDTVDSIWPSASMLLHLSRNRYTAEIILRSHTG